MEQPVEKFGNVYLSHLDEDGKDTGPKFKLDGVRFSNWDHRWYDERAMEINNHPKFIQHTKQKYYLEMTIKTRNPKTMEEGSYTGRLLAPFVIGEVKLPDLCSIPNEDLRLLEFITELGIVESIQDQEANRLGKFHAAGLACMMAPGVKLKECRGFSQFLLLSVLFDDFLEEAQFYQYSELNVFKHALYEVLNGRDVNWSQKKREIPNYGEGNENNILDKILEYVRRQSQYIYEKRNRLGVKSDALVERLLEFFDAIMMDNCCEWVKEHDDRTPLYRTLQEKVRQVTIAAYVMIEFLMFERGASLDVKIRNTLLVKRFYDLVAEQLGRVNDVLSFYKEMCNGEIGSFLYLLHVTDGLTIHQTMEKGIQVTNKTTKEACDVGDLLLKLYKGNEQVVVLVEIGKSLMWGHMQWYTYARRYHPDLVFDCVVLNNM